VSSAAKSSGPLVVVKAILLPGGCVSVMKSRDTHDPCPRYSEAFSDLPEGVDLEIGELKELADKHRGEGGGESRQQEVCTRARHQPYLPVTLCTRHNHFSAAVRKTFPPRFSPDQNPIVAIAPPEQYTWP